MKTIKIFAAFLGCICSISAFALDLNQEPEVRDYIQKISTKYNFNQKQLNHWFSEVEFRHVQSTVGKSQAAKAPTPYYIYRNKIITPSRVKAGVAFWHKHQKELTKAQQTYGVPMEVIVGIIGIETTYGENTGHSSAFSGLTTLAFNHPTRQAYFTDELTSFLLLSREKGWNPLKVRSSFDGGLGLAQFMPSSYREYAVDSHNRPGAHADLWKGDDAIASIGNYLKAKGWRPGQSVAVPARVLNTDYQGLGTPNGKPIHTLSTLQQEYGLVPIRKVSPSPQAGVLFLKMPDSKAPWITFENLAVIKRYNANPNYAMTVYELGNTIAAEVRE